MVVNSYPPFWVKLGLVFISFSLENSESPKFWTRKKKKKKKWLLLVLCQNPKGFLSAFLFFSLKNNPSFSWERTSINNSTTSFTITRFKNVEYFRVDAEFGPFQDHFFYTNSTPKQCGRGRENLLKWWILIWGNQFIFLHMQPLWPHISKKLPNLLMPITFTHTNNTHKSHWISWLILQLLWYTYIV